MASKTPFSVMQAGRQLAGRGQQIDSQVAAAQQPGSGNPTMSAARDRAVDMGGAPRGEGRGHYGAPIAKPMVGSQDEPMQAHEIANPSPQQAMQMARQSVNRTDGAMAGEQPATAQEQAEYERVQTGMSRVLYEDLNTSTAIIDMIQPNDKIGSVATAAIMTIKQLDEKMDIDENVFAQVAMETVDRIVDLGEQTKQIEYSDEDVQAALGATWEGLLQLYNDPEGVAGDFEELTQGMSDEDLQGQVSQYKQFLGE